MDLPLTLYVHSPWCVRKCPYCDFNSHTLKGALPEAAFLQALQADLMADLRFARGRSLAAVFIGGGTPSLLSARALETLLLMIEKHCSLTADAEITLEVNPGTLERGQLRDYAAAGINRVSLGVQSFAPAALQVLGRIHSSAEAEHAIQEAQDAKFASFNVDLMYGLPGQSLDEAARDLEKVLAFAVPHLSWYQLTIEPNTAFYSQPPELPAEEAMADIEAAGFAMLEAGVLTRYEISAYSRAGHESRHNLNYWRFGDYIGIGPGAHSKLTLAPGRVRRHWKFRQPDRYLQKQDSYIAGQTEVCGKELSYEYLMNAMRLVDGTSEALYQQRTQHTPGTLHGWRTRNLQRGLLMPDRFLQATPRGLRFLNDLLLDFLN